MSVKRKFQNRFRHTAFICLEIFAVIFVLAIISAGVVVWRVSSGSVDITFARSYIEKALYDPVNGFSVSFNKARVSWPDFEDVVVLDIENVNISRRGKKMLDIDAASLGVSLPQLFLGKVSPESIILTGPSLQMIRRSNTNFEIGLQQQLIDDLSYGPPTKKVHETAVDENIFMRVVRILSKPEGQVDTRSPLHGLNSLEIREAQMVIEDYVQGMTWFLEPINLTFNREGDALVVSADVSLPGGRDRVSEIRGSLTYFYDYKNFRADIHLQDFDPRILSRKLESLAWLENHDIILNGTLSAYFNQDMEVKKAAVNLSSRHGSLRLDNVYDTPFSFDNFYVDASYQPDQDRIDVKELVVKAKGVELKASSEIIHQKDKADATVNVTVPNLSQEKIAPLWPDVLRGEGAEIWLTQKLSEGDVKNIAVDFNIAMQKISDEWQTDIRDIRADFDIEDMTIDYRAPLAPARHAYGQGTFAEDKLTIAIDEAVINDVNVNEGTVVIDNIIEGQGTADISVNLSGPLQNVFQYIQPEPIGMDEERLGINADAVSGQATLDVHVSFPAIRDLLAEQVKVNVNGKLNDVVLPDVVKDMDLSGGVLDLEVEKGAVELKGSAKLDGRNVKFNWLQYISSEENPFSSRIVADIEADRSLRYKFGIALDDWVSGRFPVNVTYTEFGNGEANAQIIADLTPGSFFVEPFDYVKKPGQSGEALCQIIFKNGEVTEVNNLDIKTDELSVSDMRLIFDQVGQETVLRRGSAPHFVLKETDIDLEFEIAGENLLKVKASGPFMDAQPFLDKNKEERAGGDGEDDNMALQTFLDIDRLRTHPARIIENVKIYMDMDPKGEIRQFEMDAVAGKGDIYFRLKPNERGMLSAHLEAGDAGAALRAFDVYENVNGGTITLYGEANPAQPRTIAGELEMRNFKVVRAPVLAQLLNTISLVGIPELLANDGLNFARLESDFEWQLSRDGDIYEVDDGRTSGSTIGLTFEGTINKQTDRIDLKGTIVPMSMFNEMISAIPLIGDILGGGKDSAVIAATYTLKGPVKQPEVMVNPLAALAPGFLRRIFFE